MKNETLPHPKRSEKGQSLVELSVCLVIFLVLLAGIVDLGRAGLVLISLRNSAQDAAIFASTNPTACSEIAGRAIPYNWTEGPLDVSVTIDGTACEQAARQQACAGNRSRVEVAYDSFTIATPFIGALIGRQHLSLNGTAESLILTPACTQ